MGCEQSRVPGKRIDRPRERNVYFFSKHSVDTPSNDTEISGEGRPRRDKTMPLSIAEKRKSQQKITRISLLVTLGLVGAAFLFLRYTEAGQKITDQVIEAVKGVAEPPPKPPPPPPPNPTFKRPEVDMDRFKVKSMAIDPKVDPGFDPSDLRNFGSSFDAPDLAPLAMDAGADNLANVISSSQLPTVSVSMNLPGFDIGKMDIPSSKGKVVGTGKRLAGKYAFSYLDIPGAGNDTLAEEEGDQWVEGEKENIAEYISENTGVRVEFGSRAISFIGTYRSFDNWFRRCSERALPEYRPLSRIEPEISGLKELGSAIPYLVDEEYEAFKVRARRMLADYFRLKYNTRLFVERGNWIEEIEKSGRPLEQWEKEYIGSAEEGFVNLYTSQRPAASDVKRIYSLLRCSEIMRLPILFCEPRGVPGTIHPENMRFLRTYVENGGFIYFINTAGIDNCWGVRGLIREIIQEQLADPVGEETLKELSKDDLDLSEYIFRDPDPPIFHPWTFFGMIIPRRTDVMFRVFNKLGDRVYADTLKNLLPGPYLKKNKDYRWNAGDRSSGYYIYQIEADLARKTGPMLVSHLRKLPNGTHPVFSAYFNLSEVPSTESPKAEDLPYNEPGVFGYSREGRLAICYTEGYKEKTWLKNLGQKDTRQENALKWVTNVVFQALGAEGSLARR